MGRIGKLRISRLIIGGNQFSGWAHSRDLPYLRGLFQAYATHEKIMETFEICEECGINTAQFGAQVMHSLLRRHKRRGGSIQWIATVYGKIGMASTTSPIRAI